MATQIKLPNLGENIESGDVLSILVAEGDTIKADQDIIEVETDKATMPIPSPQGGKVTKVLVSEGDTIKIGAPILEIEAAATAQRHLPRKHQRKKRSRCRREAEAEASTARGQETRARRRHPTTSRCGRNGDCR